MVLAGAGCPAAGIASGTGELSAGTEGAAELASAGAAASGRANVVSMVSGFLLMVATAASAIESRMNNVAKIVVARVRKSPAPRADIRPAGLPPVRPPPSERCIRMTPTRATAMMTWTTSKNVNIRNVLFSAIAENWAAP